MFYHSQLYSEAILYSYYVFVGIYGYYLWGLKSKDNSSVLLIVSEVKWIYHLAYIFLCSTMALFLGWFFTVYTDADKSFIANTLAFSSYNSFSDDIVGAGKFYLTAINGLNDDDVRLSKRKSLSGTRLRGFEKGKVGPLDGNDHVGGNYAAAVNFETNLPNLLPESSNTDVSLFLDFGNVWGVD